MSQIALAWVLRNPVVTAPLIGAVVTALLIGATKPHHLADASLLVDLGVQPAS